MKITKAPSSLSELFKSCYITVTSGGQHRSECVFSHPISLLFCYALLIMLSSTVSFFPIQRFELVFIIPFLKIFSVTTARRKVCSYNMRNAGLYLPREFLGLNLFEIFSVTILVLKKTLHNIRNFLVCLWAFHKPCYYFKFCNEQLLNMSSGEVFMCLGNLNPSSIQEIIINFKCINVSIIFKSYTVQGLFHSCAAN